VTGDKCVFSICCPLVTRTCAYTRVYPSSLSVCNVPPTTINRSIDRLIHRLDLCLAYDSGPSDRKYEYFETISSETHSRRDIRTCVRACVRACVPTFSLFMCRHTDVAGHLRCSLLHVHRAPSRFSNKKRTNFVKNDGPRESQQQEIRRLTTMFRIKLRSNNSMTIFYNL